MPRTTVVFVHGFLSSTGTWDAFRALLAADPEMSGRFDVAAFSYDTPAFRLNPARQIPDLDTVADGLATFLEVELSARDLVLVTHSMGGLVAQRFLARTLEAGRGGALTRLRAVVMFACPNSGSEFALAFRRGFRLRHPQEQALRPLAAAVAQTQRTVLERVVYARETSATACPVPVVAYAAESDAIVPPASAMAVFPNVGVLPGDHFSIIQPADRSSSSYLALRAALLRHTGAQPRLGEPPRRPVISPPPAAAAVAGKPLSRIVDALLAIDEVADGPSRRQLISLLSPHMRAAIPEAMTARLHVVAIVRTCMSFADHGRESLREALYLTAGQDRPNVAKAVDAIDDGWPMP